MVLANTGKNTVICDLFRTWFDLISTKVTCLHFRPLSSDVALLNPSDTPVVRCTRAVSVTDSDMVMAC